MSLLDKSNDVWRRIYLHYDSVFRAKTATQKDKKKRDDLLRLDKWYQEELPTVISQRKEKCIKHEELAKLMKWKLMRGKFRPRLQELAEGNSAESVETASRKAFKAVPNLRSAVEALTVLKGVGPATASAVLAAGAPHLFPFMADESMLALPGLQPLTYTLPTYLDFAKQVSQIAKSLQAQDDDFEWTPHKVELVLWTVEMAKKLNQDEVLHLLNTDATESDSSNTKLTESGKKRKSKSSSNAVSKKKTKADPSS